MLLRMLERFVRVLAGCMRHRRVVAVLACLLCLAQTQAQAPAPALQPLKLGVVPYLSTRALLGFYEPLQKALEEKLGRRVDLITAPDYTIFHQRTMAGEYDIIVTNPVFARIAQQEGGFEPIARATTNLTPLIIVARDSPIKKLDDLRGKTIAITETIATITQIGQQLLRQQGVTDTRSVITRGHTNSIAFLQRQEADAAISSLTALKQAVPEARNSVRVIREIPSRVPPIVYLLAPNRSGHPVLAAAGVRDLLIAFADTEAGKRYIDALGHEGISPVNAREMMLLDAYADELKTLLK